MVHGVHLESDRDAADADTALYTADSDRTLELGKEKQLTTTPLEQETVVLLHSEPEPTPTTLMGLQSNPRATSRS